MAQLVKLADYISRYQVDLNKYPTQYIRLKKTQWDRLKRRWEAGDTFQLEPDLPIVEEETDVKPNRLNRLFKWIRRDKGGNDEEYEIEGESEGAGNQQDYGSFEPKIRYRPNTLQELRLMFLEQLYQFQLKWASSTALEKSHVEAKFQRDMLLRMMTTQLPDTYFLLYHPVLKVKNAPVELDILLITPTETICMTVLEKEEHAAFIGGQDRFWLKKNGDMESKVLNPLISLNRMETILQHLYRQTKTDMAIRKVVLSRTGYIDYPGSLYGVEFVDRRNYAQWFEQLKTSHFPMKHIQFKAVQSLLDTAQTTSFHRLK